MSEQEIEAKALHEAAPKPKKRRFLKFCKWTLGVLVVAVLAGFVYFKIHDRPCKYVKTSDPATQVDVRKGEAIDWVDLSGEMQRQAAAPIEENGCADLLRTFGPIALGFTDVDGTPWESFASSDSTALAYEKQWKPTCEFFGVDPEEKPLFYGRATLVDYLVKNGITGNETPPDPSDAAVRAEFDARATYCENGEKKVGIVPRETASKFAYNDDKRTQCANVVKWLEENADMFDALADAARKPKFVAPRFELDGARELEFAPIQFQREAARMLQLRARWRIENGDVSGAIDDVETMLKLARNLATRDDGALAERLVGFALAGIAVSTPFELNPERLPTTEERARIDAVFDAAFDLNRRELVEETLANEKNCRILPFVQRFLDRRRAGVKSEELLKNFEPMPGFFYSILDVAPIDDAKTLDEAAAICDEYLGTDRKFGDELFLRGSFERRLAGLLVACASSWNWDSNSLDAAFVRIRTARNLKAIDQALAAYQAERGTLPPTFTRDADGKPLHSWRTLILPYLGDDAKALYAQIKFDEPWNSDANRAFHNQAPDVFRAPAPTLDDESNPSETRFCALVGEGALFNDSGTGVAFDKSAPGADRRILVLERKTPVCWMKPDDEIPVSVFEFKPLDEPEPEMNYPRANWSKNLGGAPFIGGFNIARGGGGVEFLAEVAPQCRLRDEVLGSAGIPKDDDAIETDE